MIKDKLIKGSTIINDLDISELGMFMIQNGGDPLLLFPERKQSKSNNWYEYNGLDIDLSEIYFNDQTLEVQFYIYSGNARDYIFNLSEFYKLITKTYVSLYSREFDRSFALRYISCTEYMHTGGLYKIDDKGGKLTVSFSLDNPLQLFTNPTILAPRKLGSLLYTDSSLFVTTDTGLFIDLGDEAATDGHISHVSLNGIDFGAFGIIVNECYSSMLKLPAVKAPLTRSFNKQSGLLVPALSSPLGGDKRGALESKELLIKCTMRADNRVDFYHNYEALFNNISKLEALQIDTYLGRMNCYYTKMTDFKKVGVFSRGVMVQFTLHFTQIDPSFTYYVLGSLGDTAILTDAQEYILT